MKSENMTLSHRIWVDADPPDERALNVGHVLAVVAHEDGGEAVGGGAVGRAAEGGAHHSGQRNEQDFSKHR